MQTFPQCCMFIMFSVNLTYEAPVRHTWDDSCRSKANASFPTSAFCLNPDGFN